LNLSWRGCIISEIGYRVQGSPTYDRIFLTNIRVSVAFIKKMEMDDLMLISSIVLSVSSMILSIFTHVRHCECCHRVCIVDNDDIEIEVHV
jgi:DNA replicative helicase MCM subunit Mcm2 (Cdc46/Mcm family)